MICSKIKKYWHQFFALYKCRSDKRRLAQRIKRRKQQMKLVTLSPKAQAMRKPLPVELLVGAKHDRIHRDVGKGRAAKTVRHQSSIEPTIVEAIARLNRMTDEERDEFFEEQRVKAEQRAKIEDMFNHEYHIVGGYIPDDGEPDEERDERLAKAEQWAKMVRWDREQRAIEGLDPYGDHYDEEE